jgi:hypothetical protein
MRTSRRSALKHGLVALGGLVGVGVAGQTVGGARADAAEGSPSAVSPRLQRLTLYGRDWHSFSQVRPAGVLPTRGDRLLASGDLHFAPDGEKVGEFHAAVFSLGPPGQVGPGGAGSLELHTFNLPDGSMVGTGTASPDVDREDTFAIVGGTGRYSGARGTCVARQGHREFGGDGTAELTLTFVAEEI